MEVFLPEVASQQGQSYEITHRVHHGCQRHFKTRDHRRNLTWPIDIIEKCSCCVLLRHSINTADIKNQFNNSNLLCSCISLLIIIFLPPPHKKKTHRHTLEVKQLTSSLFNHCIYRGQWDLNSISGTSMDKILHTSWWEVHACLSVFAWLCTFGTGFCPSAAWAHWTWFWAWVVGLFPLCNVLSGCDISPSLHKIKLLQRWWNSWKMPMRVDSGSSLA